MAVYGYIRVSTAKQVSEESPKTQRITIDRLANEHGLLVDKYFEDDAYTGNTKEPEQRPAFGELVNIVKPGDTVIMSQLNRIVRRGMVLQHIVTGWYRKGVHVLVDNEYDRKALESSGYLGLVGELAELKLKEVSATTKAGMARVKLENEKERWEKKGKKRIGRPAGNQWYQKQDVIDALAAGERPDAIAKRIGIDRATVYRIRNRTGVDRIRKAAAVA